MSYDFTPYSDEELESSNLLPYGIYRFKVKESNRRTSNAGNAMAELKLNVLGTDDKYRLIWDYLVFSTIALNIKKVSHFSKSTGLFEEYKKGSLPENLNDLEGDVEIGIQEEQPKPGGGYYAKKNIVLDYKFDTAAFSNNANVSKSIENKDEDLFDKDIPF